MRTWAAYCLASSRERRPKSFQSRPLTMPMVASKTTNRLNKAVADNLNATEWRVFDEIIWCFSVIYATACI
jgi:hypothetical protein